MTVPVDGGRGDWPRLVANAVNGLLKRAKIDQVGTVAVAETLSSSFAGGVRQVTVALSGVKADDALFLAPAGAVPANYAILGAMGNGAGTFQATLITPALALGASYSISCRVYRLS